MMWAPKTLSTKLTPLQVKKHEATIERLESDLRVAESRAHRAGEETFDIAVSKVEGIRKSIAAHWQILVDGGYTTKTQTA